MARPRSTLPTDGLSEPVAAELPSDVPEVLAPPPAAPGDFRYVAAHHMRAIDPRGNVQAVLPGGDFPNINWLAPGELEALLASGALVRQG